MAVESKNLTEDVVLQIQTMITERGLHANDILCTEGELEAKLGVSRPIIREAVSRLRALGVLESKQRVGLVVLESDPASLFEEAFSMGLFSRLNLQQLTELRYVLEIGAVELVAERATKEQQEELLALADEFANAVLNDTSNRDVDEIELNFHSAILKASGNETLSRMHSVVAAYFSKAPAETNGWNTCEYDENSVWEHRAIAEALSERNVERARALLSGHLNHLLKKKQ